ncbi:MAG: RNase adapter RapZ [Clostridia bacterium]|nr:RNase adapter RapZ [Clostridia bacterium]
MDFMIVTGMSGAGKSRAMAALEDIGYYCVDNLPPVLLAQFAQLLADKHGESEKVALAVDSRGATGLEEFEQGLNEMRMQDIPYRVMFLDCDNDVLMRRYKETRRRHPLAEPEDVSFAKAIAKERKMLSSMKKAAHYRIDTSQLTTAQLRDQIVQMFLANPDTAMPVQCMSFGFKYGAPLEADMVLDVRCFRNPYYVPELKHKTGLDKEVSDFVLNSETSRGFEQHLFGLLDYMLPLYRNEGKSQLVIAIGCTGGKHRSVTFTERLAAHLKENNVPVVINHRDIKKI